jgi:N-acetylmuramic acid 6-phosphate etherase
MKLAELVTEAVNQRTSNLDELDTLSLVTAINQEDKQVAGAVAKVLPQVAAAVDIIVDALKQGGRLFYVGAGTSGRLGVLDASECPPTYGVSPELVQGIIAGGYPALVRSSEGLEDSKEEARKDLRERGVRAGDVVVALAASGRTPYAIAALEEARAVGARAIAVTCNPGSPMEQIAEVTIAPVVGPEVVAGSTRMKAGTAQKMVLNMLSTATMVKLGKVYGNLMVDVRPTNEKLMERAKRIIMQAAGVDYETAGKALAESGNDVKVAVVMCLCGVDAGRARAALAETGGFVRQAKRLLERAAE